MRIYAYCRDRAAIPPSMYKHIHIHICIYIKYVRIIYIQICIYVHIHKSQNVVTDTKHLRCHIKKKMEKKQPVDHALPLEYLKSLLATKMENDDKADFSEILPACPTRLATQRLLTRPESCTYIS